MNHSTKAIIGYSICWTGLGKDGTTTRRFQGVADTLQFKTVLARGSSELISLAGTIAQSLDSVSPNRVGKIQEVNLWLSEQSAIEIGIDAVAFEDGSIEGRDHARLFLNMRATALAEQDLYKAVKEQFIQTETLQTWLETLASARWSQTKQDRTIHAYDSKLYTIEKGRLANDLLRMLKERGFEVTKNYVSRIIDSRKYPLLLIGN